MSVSRMWLNMRWMRILFELTIVELISKIQISGNSFGGFAKNE